MPDALDGDFSRSWAVLIGTWDYHHLSDVPAAKHSLHRMRNLLTSPLCGSWPQARISVIENPSAVDNLPHTLVTSFSKVTDVALFYYVGHGQYDNDDRLCMALDDSSRDPVFRATTSLTFDAVRQAFRASKAATKIAILDCCFAGIAGRENTLGAGSAGAALDSGAGGASAGPQALEPPRAPGFYLMMASGEFSTAWCETLDDTSEPQTYFTKYLADVIENGIPGHPDRLTLGSIFDRTADALVSDGKPEPGNRGGNRAVHYILARNAAPHETQGDHDTTDPPAARGDQAQYRTRKPPTAPTSVVALPTNGLTAESGQDATKLFEASWTGDENPDLFCGHNRHKAIHKIARVLGITLVVLAIAIDKKFFPGAVLLFGLGPLVAQLPKLADWAAHRLLRKNMYSRMLRIAGNGVTVTDPFGTRRIPWTAIARVGVRYTDPAILHYPNGNAEKHKLVALHLQMNEPNPKGSPSVLYRPAGWPANAALPAICRSPEALNPHDWIPVCVLGPLPEPQRIDMKNKVETFTERSLETEEGLWW